MQIPSLIAAPAPLMPAGLPPVAAPPLLSGPIMPASSPVLSAPAMPSVIPAPTPAQIGERNYNRMALGGSGIEQMRRPVDENGNPTGEQVGLGKKIGSGLLQALDIAGSVFSPIRAIESAIPGTNEHHQLLMYQQAQNVAQNQREEANTADIQQRQALASQETAKANSLNDPPAKQGDPTKTITTADGVFAFDPETQTYDNKVGDAPDKPEKWAFQQTDHGLLRVNQQTGEAQPVTLNGQPIAGKAATRVVQLEVGGKPHQVLVNEATGEHIQDLGQTGEKPPVVNVNQQPLNMGSGDMAALVDALGTGAIKPTEAFGRGTTTLQKASIVAAVKAKYPQWNSGDNAVENAVRKDFTSGGASKTLNSFNTATAHLATLGAAADALDNGNTLAFNHIGQTFSQQTGNPAPTNFQAVKSAVAGEVSKTFKGGQATDAEIKEFDQAISSANSPAQLKGVIRTYQGLMASKREALQNQYNSGVHGQVNFGDGPSGGISVTDPSGGVHSFPNQAAADNFKKLAGIK